MFVTPAVAGDHVYVGSCSGRFFALAAASGEVAWSYDTSVDGTSAQFHGDALITDELVVVGSDARPLGFLYAFERASGEVRWSIPFAGGVAVDTRRHGGLALGVALSGEVTAVEIATGDTRWLVESGQGPVGRPPGDPALRDGRLYVPWRSGVVEALDAATGERLWRRDLGAMLNTSIEAVDDSLVVGALDGRLYRLWSRDGTVTGKFDTRGIPYGDLVVGDGCLLALWADGAEEGGSFTGPHVLACLEPDLSAVRWRYPIREEWGTFRPLVRRGQVIVGYEGTLMALTSRGGALAWQRSVDGLPRGLGASDHDLFVGTLPGPVLALPWDTAASQQPRRGDRTRP